LPGHWGLAGKTREVAKAEYELSGYELKCRLLEINKDDLDSDTYTRKSLDIELEFNKLTKSEYNRELAALIKDDNQRALALLEIDRADGNVTDAEYEKQSHTLNGKPWVTVTKLGFGGEKSLEGAFELDWNELFIAELKSNGYKGHDDDSIVNQWFMEVCRNVAMEEFDGTGDFTADSEANLNAMKRWHSESAGEGKRGYR
jgi:hypothetical protein